MGIVSHENKDSFVGVGLICWNWVSFVEIGSHGNCGSGPHLLELGLICRMRPNWGIGSRWN